VVTLGRALGAKIADQPALIQRIASFIE